MKKLWIVMIVSIIFCGCNTKDWKQISAEKVREFGHRNWIVIADSAYPMQSSAGIETIYTGKGHFEVLQTVLRELEKSNHVRPLISVDAEMDKITEADAPGISEYRNKLKEVLAGKKVEQLEHMQIISKLDEAGKLFNILILKTDLTVPYSSVFIELDCAYWDGEREKKLREALK